MKILRSTALPADRWIDDRHAASSARPVQFSSAFSVSKRAPQGQILELLQSEDDSQAHPNIQLNC